MDRRQRQHLVDDATKMVIAALYALSDEQGGQVQTHQIEAAVHAGMEALLIYYAREMAKPSQN